MQEDEPPSPTLTKVLDTYLEALKADAEIDDDAAGRLDALLRKGKTLKPDDFDAALFPQNKGECAS